jgi:hypothetical protein
MQAVILWTLGTSWPHSRKASPVHICCASDEKARFGRTKSAVAAMAKRSAILLVRWKFIDAFPKVACGADRCSLGALHAACAAARVIRHAGVTRCGCSISADVRIKSAAPPYVNYELMLRSCNGSRQHFPNCCVRATSTEAQMRDSSGLTLPLCEVDGFRTGVSHVPGLNTSRVMTALSGWSRRRVRSRASLARAVPVDRACLSRHKTQYKCGNSRVRNNHPLGKPRYDQRLLLHPPDGFVGVRRLSKPAFRMAHKCLFIPLPMDPRRAAIRAMEWPRLEAFRTVGLKP